MGIDDTGGAGAGGDPGERLAQRLQSLEDRAELWELACRYALAVDDADADALGETFAAEARFESISGVETVGRPDIVAYVLAAAADTGRQRVHTPTSQVLGQLGDGRASGLVSSFAAHVGGPDPVTFMALRYADGYVREEGRWRFASRRIHAVRRLLGA